MPNEIARILPPSGWRSPNRRQFLTGAALLGGAAATGTLAGCGGPAAAGEETLRFWHLLSGGDGVKMQAMIDRVNAESPDFDVVPTVLAWGTPYYTKLAMASAGGRPPELAIMHASRIPGYAPGGLLDAWDLDELAKRDVSKETFADRVWASGELDGDIFSIALDSHPFIAMYNTDVAGEAGLLGSDGLLTEITDPERFLEAMREMQAVTGGHGLSYGYINDGAQMWRLFYTLYRQHGAEMALNSGQPADVDRDVAIDCLTYITSLLDDTICASGADINNAIAEFATGGSGMLFSGVWELPTMQDAGIAFDAMTIPTLFGTPAAYADSHAFVLPHQNDVDEARRAAAYDFVANILKGSLSWAEAGHIPAYQPVVNSEEYRSLEPQVHYANAAEIINYDPRAWFTGSGSDFQTFFAANVQNVFLGREAPDVGWDAFVDRLNTILSKPNPV
ncbi:extracellular solute-binding protein [uncultured Arthrobacter sp.]|uniref:extracellular solute-binding protein n=1 Tax=uncultured Arthrobacter sp. TaxID=114050 RepID=UPI002604AEA6|nr:extracellular solute-binding protein [uncultured Arthrobacter sp.]